MQCTVVAQLTILLGETIPIRLFLGGFDLTPTFREVNKKYSTRYYLSLVLIDEGKSLHEDCWQFAHPTFTFMCVLLGPPGTARTNGRGVISKHPWLSPSPALPFLCLRPYWQRTLSIRLLDFFLESSPSFKLSSYLLVCNTGSSIPIRLRSPRIDCGPSRASTLDVSTLCLHQSSLPRPTRL